MWLLILKVSRRKIDFLLLAVSVCDNVVNSSQQELEKPKHAFLGDCTEIKVFVCVNQSDFVELKLNYLNL